MIKKKISTIIIAAALAGFLFPACNKWDDHNAVTDPEAGKTLVQQINEQPDLSLFAGLLEKSGFDKELGGSKTYTVFAPNNAAMQNLDPGIAGDSLKLRRFIGNHIATQTYFTTAATDTTPVLMLTGKYHDLLGKKLDEANITQADKYAKNGVLQVIDQQLPALQTTWEFVESSPDMPAQQKAYMLSIFRNVFDITNAIQIGVDVNTGRPIYQPGTDSVRTNLFWRSVYDLRDEKGKFTLFVLEDQPWENEVTKFKPYFLGGTEDSTLEQTRWGVVRDLAVTGLYTAANIPDTILSKFNAKMGIQKSAITKSIKTSNGIVHVMSKLEVLPRHKFRERVIQGEAYRTASHSRIANTFFRDKLNPNTGQINRDVLVFEHGIAQFNLGYRLTDVPSIKYKVYWVALHDNVNGITASFTQKFSVGTINAAGFAYTTVNPNNYNEVYVGEFTVSKFNPALDVFLVAANSTTAAANMLICDYIRLEPSF